MLCSSPLDPTGWDHAIVARALVQAIHTRSIPWGLRRKARNRYIECLEGLVAMARKAPNSALVWADDYGYGAAANNQWATIWALMPSLADSSTPQKIGAQLHDIVRNLLLAHDRAASNSGAGVSSRIDLTGRGSGTHVFGTCMSVVAWVLLTRHKEFDEFSNKVVDEGYSERAVRRLLSIADRMLELPSQANEQNPLELEGYFAWAGILLACAAVGVVLPEAISVNVLNAASRLDQIDPTGRDQDALMVEYIRSLEATYLFDATTKTAIARSAARITKMCMTFDLGKSEWLPAGQLRDRRNTTS